MSENGGDTAQDHGKRRTDEKHGDIDGEEALEEIEREDERPRPLAQRAVDIRRADVAAAVFADVDVPDGAAKKQTVRHRAQKVGNDAGEKRHISSSSLPRTMRRSGVPSKPKLSRSLFSM